MCRLLRHERDCNAFTIIDIIGTIVTPRKQGWKAELMTVCKHIITKLPYVNLERILSNDTVSMNTGIYPVFCIPSPRPLSYAEQQLCKPRCEAVVSGVTGAIEALGHQQVVCFYSHIWVREPWPKLKQPYTKILDLKSSATKGWRMHKIKVWPEM